MTEKFTNQDVWIRYLGSKCATKIAMKNDEARNLEYIAVDSRYRINKGRWDIHAIYIPELKFDLEVKCVKNTQ